MMKRPVNTLGLILLSFTSLSCSVWSPAHLFTEKTVVDVFTAAGAQMQLHNYTRNALIPTPVATQNTQVVRRLNNIFFFFYQATRLCLLSFNVFLSAKRQ